MVLGFDAACALRGRACSAQGRSRASCAFLASRARHHRRSACTAFTRTFLLLTRVCTAGSPHTTSLRPTKTTITTVLALKQRW